MIGDQSVSPNARLTEAGRALAYARALTARDPEHLHDVYFAMAEMRSHPERFPQGIRHEIALADRRWWWTIDPETGTGQSSHEPPGGVPTGASIIRPPGFRPAWDAFLRLAGAHPELPLDRTVRAADPAFNCTYFGVVLESLRGVTPEMLDQRARGALADLSALRRGYAADLRLVVGLAGSLQLLGAGLNHVRGTTEVSRLFGALRARPDAPMAAIELIGDVLITDGMASIVLATADREREVGSRLIEQALEAPTLEQHLDGVYGALPAIMTSMFLYDVCASRTTEPVRSRCARVQHAQEELLVRASMPFVTQILDLDGGWEWVRHREIVQLAGRQEGTDGAGRAARRLIEEGLYYPRAFLPVLLSNR
jgi:hypothetical protein